ncbi:hypothetical protein V5O48_016561, partial [Marasmius crinis-equi]
MDLILSDDSPKNTTLSRPSGELVYEISTPPRAFGVYPRPTTLRRSGTGASDEIGIIGARGLANSMCLVSGRDVMPGRLGMFQSRASGMAFKSSNGQMYTWKRGQDDGLLIDNSKTTIAIYEASHSGLLSGGPHPAKLWIARECEEIADEIVATWV